MGHQPQAGHVDARCCRSGRRRKGQLPWRRGSLEGGRDHERGRGTDAKFCVSATTDCEGTLHSLRKRGYGTSAATPRRGGSVHRRQRHQAAVAHIAGVTAPALPDWPRTCLRRPSDGRNSLHPEQLATLRCRMAASAQSCSFHPIAGRATPATEYRPRFSGRSLTRRRSGARRPQPEPGTRRRCAARAAWRN